jgi:asparagine synthase (glutamine-hydrolysing)
MCGIAGILLKKSDVPEVAVLMQMAEVMSLRGPDDEGVWATSHIGLTQRRLSIRDLSFAGHCPMSSADGNLHLVFNGEIYNWRELRRELEQQGYVFTSHTDSEVLLHGYHVWREDLVNRLRGMFAFGIWDQQNKTLWLVRDRAGEKPLFYVHTEDVFAFASSPEALLVLGLEGNINPVGIACHLVHSFIPAGHTVWQHVQTLSPAHSLSIKPGGKPKLSRYWDFSKSKPVAKNWTKCIIEIEAALEDSIVRCLDADVPVGVFLSGGVDSSIIAALAARHCSTLKSFSLGFSEASHSELPYAERVAEHLGIDHYSVSINADDVIKCLPHLVRQYAQPFGDPSAVPTYLLSRFSRQEVKVALAGDGGDELFGGYWRMQSGVYAARYAALLPRGVRSALARWLPGRLGWVGRRWSAMNSLSLAPPGAGYTNAESWYGRLAEIAGPALSDAIEVDLASLRVGKSPRRGENSVVQRLLYDDFVVQLPDCYLTKVDVASMAASLEVRSPFLDPVIMELAWSLPDRTKLHRWRRKVLLKALAANYVPNDVIYRTKMGFGMPLDDWFRGRLGEFAGSIFQRSHAVKAGYISGHLMEKTLARHRRQGGEATRLWSLLWLELWFRQRPA